MKNVLLLYPIMLFYKIPIFNELAKTLKSAGYNLVIWPTEIQNPNNDIAFECIHNVSMNRLNFQKILIDKKIDIIINILFKSDPGYSFYIYSIFYPRFRGIKVIFYGHGVNKQKESYLRNNIYNLTYFFFNGIILYTPGEKKKIWKIFHKKITTANNTLIIGSKKNGTLSKTAIKEQYGFTENRIILSTGRLQGRKKIEVLLKIFKEQYSGSSLVRWLLVGPELDSKIQEEISTISNISYFGPQYDPDTMAKIFQMADIYCVPGALGLGIVEAFYWGLPILTLNVSHGPEAYYLRNDKNCFITKSSSELSEKLNLILTDDYILNTFSMKAREIYEQEATLDKMFSGFTDQLARFK